MKLMNKHTNDWTNATNLVINVVSLHNDTLFVKVFFQRSVMKVDNFLRVDVHFRSLKSNKLNRFNNK